jgi:hypothetical protein
MPSHDDDPFKELRDQEKKRQELALSVLSDFVSEYSPAENKADANTFYSTIEIRKSILEHTGTALETSDIFELMKKMGYKCEAMEDLNFQWLLKK